MALREGHWILRGPDGEITEHGCGLARWLGRPGMASHLRVASDQALALAIDESGSGPGGGFGVEVPVPMVGAQARLLLNRVPLTGAGELWLVRRYQGASPPLDGQSSEAAEAALRLEHLIRGHLATRLLAPLAHLAGPSSSIASDAGLLGDGAFQERLVRYVARAMENVLIRASEVLPEARGSGRPPGWVEPSRMMHFLAGSYMSPVGARVSQRIEVLVQGPLWLRVNRPRFRLLMERCLDLVLSSGLNARVELVPGQPWPVLRIVALPPTGSSPWGLGDLSLVPAAQALAGSLGMPMEFNLGAAGLVEIQQALVGSAKGHGPAVGLCCLDEDLLDLLSALLSTVGVVVVDLHIKDGGAAIAMDDARLDFVLVDLDSQELSSTRILAELRKRAPQARLLALSSEPVVDEGWNAIASKPVSLARLVELLEFVGE